MPKFKEDAKFTKIKLVETGRRLLNFKEQLEKIESEMKEFEEEESCLFDVQRMRDSIFPDTTDLYEAIDLIEKKLGKMELTEGLKK